MNFVWQNVLARMTNFSLFITVLWWLYHSTDLQMPIMRVWSSPSSSSISYQIKFHLLPSMHPTVPHPIALQHSFRSPFSLPSQFYLIFPSRGNVSTYICLSLYIYPMQFRLPPPLNLIVTLIHWVTIVPFCRSLILHPYFISSSVLQAT